MTEITRRHLLTTMGVAAGAALTVPRNSFAQGAQSKGVPTPGSAPTVISNPPRDFGPDGPPTTYFADPDVLTIDPAFDGLIQANTPIKRLWTGALWAEGPACGRPKTPPLVPSRKRRRRVAFVSMAFACSLSTTSTTAGK